MLLNTLEKDLGEDSVDFLNIFQPRNSASSKDKSDGNSDCVDFWNVLETANKKSVATEAERKEKRIKQIRSKDIFTPSLSDLCQAKIITMQVSLHRASVCGG